MTDLADLLTNEQCEVLTAAQAAGYFERPRRTPGVEVAESLNLPPTIFQVRLQEALTIVVEDCVSKKRGE